MIKKPTRRQWMRGILNKKVGPLPPTALVFNPFLFSPTKPFHPPRSLAIVEKLKKGESK